MKTLKFLLHLILMTALLGSCTPKPSADMANTLDAIRSINTSIYESNRMVDDKNEKVVKLMQHEKRNQPEKIEELLKILGLVHNKTTELETYIKSLIKGLNESGNDGDVSIVNSLLAEGKDGDSLKTKLLTYEKDIKALMAQYPLPSQIPLAITPSYVKDGQAELSWKMAFFHNMPKIAAITMLNKFENDIKNTEAMCIDRLAKESVATDIILDQFEPVVSAKSSTISLGEKYEASIELGAASSAICPEIIIGGKKFPIKDYRATYTTLATAKGTFTVPVIIKMPGRQGMHEFEGEIKYTVR